MKIRFLSKMIFYIIISKFLYVIFDTKLINLYIDMIKFNYKYYLYIDKTLFM
uniref:hypothetical protein n=1 Tax=Laurencia catarinensis TaxID=197326 RepID=UPI0028D22DE1|nr:hypothetical protein RU987_pgp209 [Laurencia catarinensis]WMP12371.1 hypothetical protein [Laurencia catarinensis]